MKLAEMINDGLDGELLSVQQEGVVLAVRT